MAGDRPSGTAMHRVQQFDSHHGCVIGRLDVGQHHHKLVATQPGHDIGVAHAVAPPGARPRWKQLVARTWWPSESFTGS